MDKEVRRLSAFAVWVNCTDRLARISSGGNFDIRWRRIKLNGPEAIRDIVLRLFYINTKGERNDLRDVGIWTEDADRDTQTLTK
jgi:hypothetical protein